MNAGLKFLIAFSALAVVVECVVNYPQQKWPVRVHRSGASGPPGRYRPPVKRVYMPTKYAPHANINMNRNHRNQPPRYAPTNKRSPPGWKPKRMGPPPNYTPQRKNRTKPPKYNKYNKNTKHNFNKQVLTDSYGAPKNQYKIPSTTYGIPHPTQGLPEPPKKDVATSYVQVYQGDYQPDRELEAKTSYSFTNTHEYQEKHKGKVYDDSNHRPVYNHTIEENKKGFQPPKQTFGFQPYDDEDYQKDYYKTSTKPNKTQKEEFLSPSYYDQQ